MLSDFVSSIQKNKSVKEKDHESPVIGVVEIFKLCILLFRRLRTIIDRDLDDAIKIFLLDLLFRCIETELMFHQFYIFYDLRYRCIFTKIAS
ncbi:hypothetical protein RIR_jg32372.t1 [Rhizophagus irregularis DAOM 181602=DAOM 197198]|nr:hypothetical protein RIR_jg32372.t1 [Rhizophagus irregularis DAOM 181602=DAOM 197198]